MIQNSPIARFVRFSFLLVAVVALSLVGASNAFSQIVNSAAFDQPAGHSILEVADEEETTSIQAKAARFSSVPPTKIAQDDSTFDAPVAPQPRMTGAKPLAPNQGPVEANSSGTFTSSHAVVTKGVPPTATVNSQISDKSHQTDQDKAPRYQSAYLHDQRPQRDTSVEDMFGSSANPHSPPSKVQQPKASLSDESFQAHEKNFVQQTAYLSPAAPARPQFQNTKVQPQNNRQFGQPQTNRRGQRNQSSQLTPRGQSTRQRSLPRENQLQSQQQSRSQQQPQSQQQSQQQSQSQSSDSAAAKQAIAKFSFDANQQMAEGLPIRLGDVLQQSSGRAGRNQLIPQYWEVYYDWAQSVSAKHHLDWVGSINSAQRNDASSIEIAKSNAQNEITFTAIQLGKSQAKMKALTGTAQPIIPMDSPTVTRVKTNYQAFKNRGMIAPKFEGIDATLKQMHELIASRANTVTMAQKNADEAKQLYSRNQSTVDHVLSAGRTWRAAESDFIASIVEYNKAYADYALALPYGRGPIETVVNMLIVKPTNKQNVSSQAANGRPNLSNDTGTNFVSKSNSSGDDYSIPYRGNSSNQQNSRAAQSLQSQRTQQSNAPQLNRGPMRHASDTTGPRPDGPSDQGQASARNLMRNAQQATTARPAVEPSARFNAGGQTSPGLSNGNAMTERTSAEPRLIKRPSQFPTSQSAAASNPFSPAAGSRSPATGQPNPPAQKSFQQRPNTQPPASDRTAARPNPFTAAGSTDGASSAPATTPKPPTSSTGFSFGG